MFSTDDHHSLVIPELGSGIHAFSFFEPQGVDPATWSRDDDRA